MKKNNEFIVNFRTDSLILDPSIFLYIERIHFKVKKFYIPESFYQLVLASQESEKHYEILNRLMKKFTFFLGQRNYSDKDLYTILNFFNNNKERIHLIHRDKEEITDQKLFNEVYESTKHPRFDISLSPNRNVFSEIIASIVACSKKLKIPILSKNRYLSYHLRKVMVIIDSTNYKLNQIVTAKQNFFELSYPIRKTRGLRFFLCILVGVTLDWYVGTALVIFDP